MAERFLPIDDPFTQFVEREDIERHLREERDFPKTLFVSAAENEAPFREDIEDFIDVLKQQGIDHSFLLHPGNHNDGTWRTVIEEILIHLLLGVSS